MWLLFRAGHSRQCNYYSELGTRDNVPIIQSWALATTLATMWKRLKPTNRYLLPCIYIHYTYEYVDYGNSILIHYLLSQPVCTPWQVFLFQLIEHYLLSVLPEDSFSTKFSKMTYFLYSMTIFYLPTYQTYLLSLFQRQSFHLQLIKHYLLSFLPKTILFSSNLSNSTYFPSPQAILSLHNIVLASTLFSKHL